MSAWLEKMRSIGGVVRNGTPRFHTTRQDLQSACKDNGSPVSQMLKDKTMFKHIKEGNASDKSLKKDAELIQVNHSRKLKQEKRQEGLKKIEAKREVYRKRYKAEPI